ncbi:MAG: cob(I)yrinic acid a,c-diamide adenosyltransferase [Chloroflexota bacterium]|nr:cob(I)yrinic acid a,c-diamide adenosyltransferase [Chloroflexota bacterium]|tara:strand:+ start:10875 stop:11453 length:579 start_codon:yes stop_codon:yes gene_type:complete
MAKIYTKNGDEGETNLFIGGSVPKSDIRVEAYGTVDEVVSSIGFAKTQCKNQEVIEIIEKLQHSLFKVGAELSIKENNKEGKSPNDLINTIDIKNIKEAEEIIDATISRINIGNEFIMPGASAGSAALDISRTIIRRLERCIVKVDKKYGIENKNIIVYINRLSDLIFVLARLEDKDKDTKKIRGIRKSKND